jgi:hypothetical protein
LTTTSKAFVHESNTGATLDRKTGTAIVVILTAPVGASPQIVMGWKGNIERVHCQGPSFFSIRRTRESFNQQDTSEKLAPSSILERHAWCLPDPMKQGDLPSTVGNRHAKT